MPVPYMGPCCDVHDFFDKLRADVYIGPIHAGNQPYQVWFSISYRSSMVFATATAPQAFMESTSP